MSVSTVQSEKVEIPNATGTYNAYQVGYFGDEAGVRLYFKDAKYSQSAMHQEETRTTFNVVTTSETHTSQTLKDKISSSNRSADWPILFEAHRALVQFIRENGIINPESAKDWENSEVMPLSGCSRKPSPIQRVFSF